MNHKCIALILVCFFALSCKTKQSATPVNYKVAAKSDSLLPPRITVIADLPDSLKPKTVPLDKMPRPLVVKVPERAGGFYTLTDDAGVKQKIDLKPPVTSPLQVLKNEKGDVIKDNQGNPFIVGNGGISHFTNYSINDGLALNAVLCSMVDHTGNLWVGTQGAGVSRYDGQTFTTFNKSNGLADVYISSIMEDHLGRIWFNTYRALTCYDGKKFTSFKLPEGFEGVFISVVTQDKSGSFWFATSKGVLNYNGKKFRLYTSRDGLVKSESVTSIIQDKASNIWFGTLGGGVSKYDGKSFTNFTLAQGLASMFISSIAEDKVGNLWFGAIKAGVSRYDGKEFTTFTPAQGIGSKYVASILADKTGNLWFGTFDKGVTKYDGRSFTNFTSDQGLAGNNVQCLSEDKSGNIWIGIYGGGLSRYNDNAFTYFGTSQGLSSPVARILEDNAGNLWLSTFEGLSHYDGRSFTTFTRAQGLASGCYAMAEDHAGNLWIGANGVSRYDGRSFTTFTTAQGLAKNDVNYMTEDRAGNLWIGTKGGVSRYDGKAFTLFTTAQGLGENDIGCIFQDRSGNLWFGGQSTGGLSRYDGKEFCTFTTAQGLAGNDVRCITQDQSGNLWIGTDGGVSRYDGKEFTSFTTDEGLADNYVYSILQNKPGDIFITTNVGLTVLNHSVVSLPFSQARKAISYYNSLNGYQITDLYRNSMFCDSKGIIWLGTNGNKYALVRFDPSALRADDHTPFLAIRQIKINEEKVCWNDLMLDTRQKLSPKTEGSLMVPANITEEVSTLGRQLSDKERDSVRKQFNGISFDSVTAFYPLPVNLVLPYDQNQITIDFNAVELGNPTMISYQYILDGYNKDWSPVSKNTSATFGNMSEGKYTFRVKAQSPNGLWGDPVFYTFRVLPPWWRTWWAYAFYGLCFLVALYFTDRIRRKVVIERERGRTKDRELLQAKEIEKAYHTLQHTQMQLIQSEKMASLGELTAGIAHEIQNPLNFVNNFSEVNTELIEELKTELKQGNDEEVLAIANDIKANEEKINHHGKRADSIVKGMLQHSRSSSGIKEPTNINKLADEYLRLAYQGLRAKDKTFNATMQTDLDETISKINIIPQDIGRVLLNLYNNAFYAVNEKKKQQPDNYEPTVSVSAKKIGDAVEIIVKDNGTGIPQKIADKIFQPFFTTKPTGQGTGLGLSLSYDIVKAHGGEIKVETVEDEGTEFIIKLPVV